MWVVATKLGFYGIKRRHPGEVFKLKDEKDFSKVWMKQHEDGADESDSLLNDVQDEPQPPKRVRGKRVRAIPDDEPAASQSDDDVI